jgi:hypothetical protein
MYSDGGLISCILTGATVTIGSNALPGSGSAATATDGIIAKSKKISRRSLDNPQLWTPVRTGFACRRTMAVCGSMVVGAASVRIGRDRIGFAPPVRLVRFSHLKCTVVGKIDKFQAIIEKR